MVKQRLTWIASVVARNMEVVAVPEYKDAEQSISTLFNKCHTCCKQRQVIRQMRMAFDRDCHFDPHACAQKATGD
jgi:hypothetical protein